MIKNRIVSNVSWIVVCKIIQSLMSLTITMFTARYLGPNGYGIINYATSLVAFVFPLVNLGINDVLVQKIVNHPDDEGKIIGTATCMTVATSLIGIVGIGAFSTCVNVGEYETAIVCTLYSISLIFQNLELIRYWFAAKLMASYSSIVAIIAYFITSCYRVYLLISQKNVYWFSISQSIDFAIIAVVLFIIYKFKSGQKLSLSKNYAVDLFLSGRYYIISNIMVTIFAHTDKLMIKSLLGSEATGFYSAAVACASITSFVFTAILDSARPVVFESKKKSLQKYEKCIIRLYSVIILISLLQCVGITLFAKLIIQLIYGSSYFPAIDSLRIIVWYTTFSYIGAVRNVWMLAEGIQKYLWVVNLSGAVANIGLNLLFIPLMGINGAALASLLTQIFTNVVMGIIIKPIRKNNKLMLESLNPRVIIDMIREIK